MGNGVRKLLQLGDGLRKLRGAFRYACFENGVRPVELLACLRQSSFNPFSFRDITGNFRRSNDRSKRAFDWRNRQRNIYWLSVLTLADGFKMFDFFAATNEGENIGLFALTILRNEHRHRFSYGLRSGVAKHLL